MLSGSGYNLHQLLYIGIAIAALVWFVRNIPLLITGRSSRDGRSRGRRNRAYGELVKIVLGGVAISLIISGLTGRANNDSPIDPPSQYQPID